MIDFHYSKAFQKDMELMQKRNLNLKQIRDVMNDLIHEKSLSPKYKDHELKGNYVGHRECHIKPDWLLIYYYREDKTIVFYRTGSHADLF